MTLVSRLKATLKKRIFYVRDVSVGSATFRAPVLQGETVYIQETWMRDVLAKLFPVSPGTMIDVGVNLGQTLLTMRSIDRKRAYIGFEPNISCAAYVDELIRMNDLQNTTVFPVAVFDQNAALKLNFTNDNKHDSSASVVKDFRPDSPVVETRSILGIRIDQVEDIFPDQVGVIKIDVEGAEHAVLQSLRSTIEKDRPLIVLEILPAYDDSNEQRIANNRSIEAFCNELDYRIARIGGKGKKISFEALDGIETHGDLEKCDYVFYPAEKSI